MIWAEVATIGVDSPPPSLNPPAHRDWSGDHDARSVKRIAGNVVRVLRWNADLHATLVADDEGHSAHGHGRERRTTPPDPGPERSRHGTRASANHSRVDP